MRRFTLLVILGVAWALCGLTARAAAPSSGWPSLNADGAQSNANLAERSLTARAVRSLHVVWAVPLPWASYPVVAGGVVYVPTPAGTAVHAAALDAATGKVTRRYTVGAAGGLLVAGGKLYLAGRSLEVFDPATGKRLTSVAGSPRGARSTFAYPVADRHVVVAGYAPESHTVPNSLYAVSPDSARLLWHVPSLTAQGAVIRGRVLDLLPSGSEFFDESGRPATAEPKLFGDWFGGRLDYIVSSAPGRDARVYAYDGAGRLRWSRRVGPVMGTQGWAHAVGPAGLYVMTEAPEGIAALDPISGRLLWHHHLSGIARIAYANGMVFVLTAGVGQPVHLAVFDAAIGKRIGVLALSDGYYAFPALNELMVADGMVFIRAISPANQSELIALAP